MNLTLWGIFWGRPSPLEASHFISRGSASPVDDYYNIFPTHEAGCGIKTLGKVKSRQKVSIYGNGR
jgi:hypothetical protein